MRKKGSPVAVTGAFERITEVIQALPLGTEFSAREVQTAVSDAARQSVSVFMSLKCRSGWLERTSRGRYRVGGISIKTTLPQGLVVEAVWTVLFTDPQRRFMRGPDITGEAEALIGRPGVSLRSGVSTILSRWHRDGHLERIGECKEYGYRIKEGLAERPVYRK